MQTLQLTHSVEQGRHRVEIKLRGDHTRRTATARFEWDLDSQDWEDLRWYLEDYLQYPIEPAPTIASRVEGRLVALGRQLFTEVFEANQDTIRLWSDVSPQLSDTRVEVATTVENAAIIPWELLRDPATDAVLALRARAFVHVYPEAAQAAGLHQAADRIRILLVICRPDGAMDVPFRSVGSHLVRLSCTARKAFQLDVLRPPTFARLTQVLRAAKQREEPYHVIHFDGHGVYADLGIGAGRHGYLLFENPDIQGNIEFVDGRLLGELLAETGVPVLMLNACRSAYVDLVTEPQKNDRDTDQRMRAYGSLAQEVIRAGVGGVVAMNYNVYVVTAAQFVGDLYSALTDGQSLGAAVAEGRAQLAAQPDREIAFSPRPLQDWIVPVVYETVPLALLAEPQTAKLLTITLDQAEAAAERANLDPMLPADPDVGFYGRDETLLTLDRAFDTQQIVLLHAWAGAGKTSTAVEFVRWYQLTGGLAGGRVLFTAFTRHMSLARVLDQVGTAFGQRLESRRVRWLALSGAEQRKEALRILAEMPVLWIWDNVELVAGFPAGTTSAWSDAEQQELAHFLRDLRGTKAKVLLTSRRDERSWLGGLPARVTLPPMPMADRVQLARAIADKHSKRLTDVEDWRPLLEFTQGNPLTITVLVGQALHNGLRTKEQIEAVVAELRKGEATISDDIAQGRDKSLAASLNYGFAQAFTDHERAQLALLHLFQGFINVDALCWMGNPEAEHCMPEVRGLTRETGTALLDRAVEIGLLTPQGRGCYGIHPALPWHFQQLFTQHYSPAAPQTATQVIRAYVEAIGLLGDYYHDEYLDGHADMIGMLTAEEVNLLHARQLARIHRWWHPMMGAMQGLRSLYGHTGRTNQWSFLVRELVPDLVDPATDGPLPGLEAQWSLVTTYRIGLARGGRNWGVAERLQLALVAWHRQRATHAPGSSAESLDSEQRNRLRSLAASLQILGDLLREQARPECVEYYEEALQLLQRISDRQAQAIVSFNLGLVHVGIPSLRDLGEAERWYRRDLELSDVSDRLGRARTVGQLGAVAYERFLEARDSGAPTEELLQHSKAAAALYEQALDLIPEDAIIDRAAIHNQLGNIYKEVEGEINTAVAHYWKAIHYKVLCGDRYGAGKSRLNIAFALNQVGRSSDALLHAEAALRDFEQGDAEAAAKVRTTQRLMAQIERNLAVRQGQSS